MEKTLKYTLTLDGAFPEETLSGGIQGENKATAIVFEADSELSSKISLYKEQGKSIEANLLAVTEAGECVDRAKQTGDNLFSPFYLTDRVTSTGLDVIIVLKLLVMEDQKEICKAQIRLSFIPSPVFCEFESENKREAEQLSKRAEEINAELEEKADDITKTIEQKLEAVKTAATLTAQQLKTVKEIADEANRTKLALESGTEFVFLGGDAFENGGEAFLIDGELSNASVNPIANKAVTDAVEGINGEIKDLADAVEGINEEIQTANQEITVLQERDYIVEQGTSGIWTYRKWASGIAECWCKLTINTAITSAWQGSVFYVSGKFPESTLNFPFAFTEVPFVNTSVDGEYSAIVINGGKRHTKTTLGDFNIARPVAMSAPIDFVVSIDIKGKWK